MALAYMQAGQNIEWGGVSYKLDRQIGNEWQLLDNKTQKANHLSIENLYKEYASGKISFQVNTPDFIPEMLKLKSGEKIAAHLDLYDVKDQEVMKQKRLFLEATLKRYGDVRSQKTLSDAIEELWDAAWGKPPSPSTAARWMKRYIASDKDIRSLGTGDFRKGNTKARYPFEVVEMCGMAIGKVYLQTTRGSINKTLEEAKRLVRVENSMRPNGYHFAEPTYSFLKGLIASISAFDKHLKRYGANAAGHKFRNAVHGVSCSRPLERVEIDHTQLDIVLVDPHLRVPIARPWVTMAIDVYTRSILGFSLSFDPPSHMTVARVLKMILLPKVGLEIRWPSIKRAWIMFGCMVSLIVDNGFEFHSESLEAACLELGINISFCPRKKSWWKARIERAIGTMNRAVTDGMPGRTYSSITEKAEYNPVEAAAISLETMEEMIAKWIVDIYHETTHSELGLKPREAWENSIRIEDIPLIKSADQLDAVVGIVANRALTHQGIELNSLRYNSDDLGLIRQQFGDLKKVVVKWSPEDLGQIYVHSPDGKVVRVPVITKQTEYATGLTYYRHLAYKTYSKKYLEGQDDLEALSIAKAELQALAEKGMLASSKKTRAQNARLSENIPKESISTQTSKTEALPTTIPQLATNATRHKFATSLSNRIENKGYHHERNENEKQSRRS